MLYVKFCIIYLLSSTYFSGYMHYLYCIYKEMLYSPLQIIKKTLTLKTQSLLVRKSFGTFFISQFKGALLWEAFFECCYLVIMPLLCVLEILPNSYHIVVVALFLCFPRKLLSLGWVLCMWMSTIPRSVFITYDKKSTNI